MYLQNITCILDGQFVTIKYDCNGGFDRCGKEFSVKLKDAKKNAAKNGGRHICRSCQMRQDNPAKRQSVQEKIKQTNLERYGTTCALNTEENTASRVEKMFGTQEAIDARTEKTKETNLALYGVEYAAQAPEKKEKAKRTNMTRYGTDHPMKNDRVKQKAKKTVKERHGVNNVMQVPEFQQKQVETTLERYGVEYYNQLPEMKDYLREHCTEWLMESYKAGGPNNGIKRPIAWNDKQRNTVELLIFEGKWIVGPKHTKKGWYTSSKSKKKVMFFRSGWEACLMFYLDNNPKCVSYDYESFSIPYEIDGSIKKYIPDFIVEWHDGLEIIEVKSSYLISISENKIAKAKSYFENLGMKFSIYSQEKIEMLRIETEYVLNLPIVKLHK